jgi:hypothetical protein
LRCSGYRFPRASAADHHFPAWAWRVVVGASPSDVRAGAYSGSPDRLAGSWARRAPSPPQRRPRASAGLSGWASPAVPRLRLVDPRLGVMAHGALW